MTTDTRQIPGRRTPRGSGVTATSVDLGLVVLVLLPVLRRLALGAPLLEAVLQVAEALLGALLELLGPLLELLDALLLLARAVLPGARLVDLIDELGDPLEQL